MKLSKNKQKSTQPKQEVEVVNVYGGFFGRFRGRFASRKSKLLLLGGVGLILVAAAGTSWFINRQTNKTENANTLSNEPCSTEGEDALLTRAATALILYEEEGSESIDEISTEIMNTPNYQNDPNCLYVLLERDISLGEYESAKSNLVALEKVYDPEKGIHSSLDQSEDTIKVLRDRVALLKKRHDEVDKYFYGIESR